MLNEGVLFLFLLNFAFIGLLPIIFFKRDGNLNLRWWATALPFAVCPAFLLAAYIGLGGGSMLPAGPARDLSALLSVPFSAGSIALIAYTLGTHRVPIALWHQRNDRPVHIVTWGAYERVRHPFYSSFLLCLFGAFVFCPHPVTVLTLILAWIVLNWTASQEEKRLRQSKFGEEYIGYMTRTGRFLPW